MKINVGVIFGGKSVEHEVSIISGLQAVSWFNKTKYNPIPIYLTKDNEMYIGDKIGDIKAYKDIDMLLKNSIRVTLIKNKNKVNLVPYPFKSLTETITEIHVAFPVVHGTNVEDGTLQGYLRMLEIPFTGCDIDASAIGMDKYYTKTILKDKDIPTLPGALFHIDNKSISEIVKEVEDNFEYPVIVKPNNLGSSVGVGIANNRSELYNNIINTSLYTPRILIEKAVTNLREINCAVLGDNEHAIASECEEPIVDNNLLSYEDKYTNNSKSKGMASASRVIPPELDKDKLNYIKNIAIKSFQTLNCCGVARLDFILDGDKIYFNEINTIPGSLSFYLWEPIGVSSEELVDRMIQLALRRYRLNNNLQFTFDTNILENANFGGSKN